MHQASLTALFAGKTTQQKYKIYRRLWQQAGDFEILTDFPLHLDIELSGLCNLKCEFCFQNGLLQGPLGFMKFNLFRKIIDEGVNKGLCAIKLQVRGESLLHPQLYDCIAYAKQQGILDVQITTNGTLLTPERIDKLLASKIDAIILSVDAHHSNSAGRTGEFTAQAAVRHLLARRADLGLSRPWIRLKASIGEVTPLAFEKTKADLHSRFPLADIIIVGRLHDFRDNVDAFPDLHVNYDLMPCGYLTQRLAIFWNGDVTTCCMDYNSSFGLGNIDDLTIEEIWSSAKMDFFRRQHKHRKRNEMPICRHCHACISAKNGSHVAVDTTIRHFDDYNHADHGKGISP